MRPRLALVPGEPAGVGPELCTRAMHRPHDADIVVFGDRDALSQAADRIGLPVSFADADAAEVPAGTIRIIDIPNAAPATPGTPDPRNAVAVIAALERSEEPTSELPSLMRISYAVFCVQKKKNQ